MASIRRICRTNVGRFVHYDFCSMAPPVGIMYSRLFSTAQPPLPPPTMQRAWLKAVGAWALSSDDAERQVAAYACTLPAVELKAALIAVLCSSLSGEEGGRMGGRQKTTSSVTRFRVERLVAGVLLATQGEELQQLFTLLDRASLHPGVVPDSYDLVYGVLSVHRPGVLQHVAVHGRGVVAGPGGARPLVLTDMDDTLLALWSDDRVPHGALYPGVRALLSELGGYHACTPPPHASPSPQHIVPGGDFSLHTVRHGIGWWDALMEAEGERARADVNPALASAAPSASATTRRVLGQGAVMLRQAVTQVALGLGNQALLLAGQQRSAKVRMRARRVRSGFSMAMHLARASAEGLQHRREEMRSRLLFGPLEGPDLEAEVVETGLDDAVEEEEGQGARGAVVSDPLARGEGFDRGACTAWARAQPPPSPLCNSLYIVTARPAGHRGFLKRHALASLSSLRPLLAPHTVALMGSLLSSTSHLAMALAKLDHMAKLHALRPAATLVWLGDSGQGDALAGVLASTAPGTLGSTAFKAALIHDLSGEGRVAASLAAGRTPPNVLLFSTYIGAASACVRAGLLDCAAAWRVASSAVQEACTLAEGAGWATGRKGARGSKQYYMGLLEVDLRSLHECTSGSGRQEQEQEALPALVAQLRAHMM